MTHGIAGIRQIRRVIYRAMPELDSLRKTGMVPRAMLTLKGAGHGSAETRDFHGMENITVKRTVAGLLIMDY